MLLFEIFFLDFLMFASYYANVIAFDAVSNCGIISLTDVIGLFPEIFLAFSLLFLLFHGTLVSSNSANNFPLIQNSICNISFFILLLTFILLFQVNFTVETFFFNNTVVIDPLSIFSKMFVVSSSFCLLLIIKPYLSTQQINSFEYCLLLLLSVFGLLFLCSSNDLMTAYLCIEVQSLSFYLLAAYKKNSVFSVDAGLKYFILGSFSSALFLLGSSIIYGSTGTFNFADLKDLFLFTPVTFEILSFKSLSAQFLELKLVNFGIACILISLFFKLAIAPFYVWSPDVYEGSLTSSTIFFAVIPKLSLFVFLIRFLNGSLGTFMEIWKPLIVLIGVFSVFIGSFVGLEVRKIKTLLAYSSVSHMGYAILAYSTNCFAGNLTVIYYLIIYIITSVCIWSIVIIFKSKNTYSQKTNKDLSDFSSLGKSHLTISVFFTMFLLSLSGFPPLIGFYAKVQVFLILMEKELFFAGSLAILFSAVSTFYYIRIIKTLFFEKNFTGSLFYPLNYYESLIITTGFFAIVFFFINPNILYLICYKMCF